MFLNYSFRYDYKQNYTNGRPLPTKITCIVSYLYFHLHIGFTEK